MSSPSTTSTTSATPAADKQRMPLWALLTGLLITGVVTHAVWRFTTSRDEAEARIGFEARASQIDITVREHLRGYEQALLGMSTIFTTGAPLTGARWAAQFDTLRLGDRYPGFQGIGYAPKVALADKARHEAAMRKDESTQYAIRPEGERPIYTPVAYLVPENERHRKAIGFDMYHETLRRAAMDEARDKGQAIITRKIVLSQEKKDSMQPGFLMYVPVYRRDAAIATKIQRQDALQGYVFSTFRMTDLANAILTTHRDIRIEIFDGAGPQANNLLYDSAPHSDPAPGASRTAQLSVLSTVPLYGGAWRLRVSTLPEFETAIDRKGARIATAGAMLICLLALTMLWSQLTLRRRAEGLAAQITRDLAHSREQLELALEGSDLALFDWNIITGEVHLSARWSLMLGGKAEPVRTTLEALEALVPPEDQPNISQQIHAVLKGNTDRYRVEHRVRRHDGSTIWIASRAKVVERDSTNRALRLVGTNVDISKQKEMDRMKNEFISNVSHELRTPITALIGALGLLRKGAVGPMPDKAVTFLDMAYQNGERLSALVNDILTLEDMRAGRMALQIAPLELAPFLERAIAINAGVANKKHIRLVLEPVPASLYVHADSERLLQLVANLLSNAVKFSPDGETVTIAAQVQDTAARVSVIDRGCGIADEFKPRLFERFVQADGSNTRSQGGAGLGLAVCKSLIEGMGGQLGYTSQAGNGASFYVDLPVAGAPAKP